MKVYTLLITGILLFISCTQSTVTNQQIEKTKRPNILLIMGDDIGFTDIGSFGGEIETPNIDALAHQGMIFSNFHTSVSCSPTRSMMMSGTDNHIAGLGNMSELLTDNQKGKPGYEGHLNRNVVSLAEVLKEGGYHTYMAGKWHLGHDAEHIPHSRGFERSFSMLDGGASHWNDMTGLQATIQPVAKYVLNDKFLNELPKDFYSSRSYADYLIECIREQKEDGKPFLAYFAPTAAHDPIHTPEPWLSKYKGVYDEGYGALKTKRINGAKGKGVVIQEAPNPDFHPHTIPWDDLSIEEKAIKTRTMEAYAGMIDNMDYHIGRIVQYLKDISEYDNTIIIFTTDNGPNPLEAEQYPGNEGSEWIEQFDNRLENIGHPNSFVGIGLGWAGASAGPLDYFKMTTGEGGIRTPMIITGPNIAGNKLSSAFAYVTDIMPTILEITGIEHPETYNGKDVKKMTGRSLSHVLLGEEERIYSNVEIICGEMMKGKWARKDEYKAVLIGNIFGDEIWRLYNTKVDPGETNDLSLQQPQLLAELQKAWNLYSNEVGVVSSE